MFVFVRCTADPPGGYEGSKVWDAGIIPLPHRTAHETDHRRVRSADHSHVAAITHVTQLTRRGRITSVQFTSWPSQKDGPHSGPYPAPRTIAMLLPSPMSPNEPKEGESHPFSSHHDRARKMVRTADPTRLRHREAHETDHRRVRSADQGHVAAVTHVTQ